MQNLLEFGWLFLWMWPVNSHLVYNCKVFPEIFKIDFRYKNLIDNPLSVRQSDGMQNWTRFWMTFHGLAGKQPFWVYKCKVVFRDVKIDFLLQTWQSIIFHIIRRHAKFIFYEWPVKQPFIWVYNCSGLQRYLKSISLRTWLTIHYLP
jgi:hypothetical protein